MAKNANSCILHCSNEAVLTGDSIGAAAKSKAKLKTQVETSEIASAQFPCSFVKLKRTFSEWAAFRMRSRCNKVRW